ncbi:MAG: helix-turn-helix transcriptional regulator [Pseudomonadales bacterium]|nr:helix-turn-helix transcriptional regulator [Pseudomonadales bacterium]
MPALTVVFLALAVSHLLLLGLYIGIYHRHSVLGVLAGCLALSLIAGLLGEGLNTVVRPSSSTFAIYLTMAFNRIGNLSVLLTWLIALKLFDDDSELSQVHSSVWALAITALVARSVGSYYANYGIEFGTLFNFVTWGYSQAVLFGFSLASIYIAIKGYRSDLVLERRKERVIFVLCVAVLLILMAGNRGVWVLTTLAGESLFRGPPLPEVAYSIYAYFVTVALILWKFRVSNLSTEKSKTKQAVSSSAQAPNELDQELMASIKSAMEDEKLYHQSNLTVAGLAEHVASQEYLVRRAINNHMGYRNFSDFLNHYRIDETSRLLAETDEPISNVGFDVGYTSLSSFYKAFKAKHAITPKKYRAIHNSNG